MNDTRTAFTIPKVFWDDHISRELAPFNTDTHSMPEDTMAKVLKYTYTVLLTEEDVFELLSDSEHYSSVVWWSGGDQDYFGLQSSARATHSRILKQLGYESFAAYRASFKEEGTR